MTAVALVGCGKWGRIVLRDLLELGAEVVVVDQHAGNRSDALRAGAQAALHEASSLNDVHGVVVVTQSSSRLQVVADVAPLHVPIFLEKPMAAEPAEAMEIVRLAGDRTYVMHKWRYHSGIEALKQLIVSGRLGEVVALRLLRLQWATVYSDADVISLLVPHDLSIVEHLLDDLPPAQWAFHDPFGRAVEGVLTGLGRPGGPQVLIESAIGSPTTRRLIVVAGTEGSAALDGAYAASVQVWPGPPGAPAGGVTEVPIAQTMPLRTELEVFVQHLSGGPPPLSPAAEAAQLVQRMADIRALAAR